MEYVQIIYMATVFAFAVAGFIDIIRCIGKYGGAYNHSHFLPMSKNSFDEMNGHDRIREE